MCKLHHTHTYATWLVLQEEEVLRQQLSELQAAVEKPPPQPKLDHLGRAAAVGGRKTSVARVSSLDTHPRGGYSDSMYRLFTGMHTADYAGS